MSCSCLSTVTWLVATVASLALSFFPHSPLSLFYVPVKGFCLCPFLWLYIFALLANFWYIVIIPITIKYLNSIIGAGPKRCWPWWGFPDSVHTYVRLHFSCSVLSYTANLPLTPNIFYRLLTPYKVNNKIGGLWEVPPTPLTHPPRGGPKYFVEGYDWCTILTQIESYILGISWPQI